MSAWHTAKTGNHQGLIIDDATGRNVAVSYDAADAALIAAAPELLAALTMAAGFIESGESAWHTFFEVREAWRNALAAVSP